MKNSQKGGAAIILIIIILLAIGGGIYFYMNKKGSVCWPYCPNITDQDRLDKETGSTTEENKKTINITTLKSITINNDSIKIFPCDNSYYSSSENKSNINGNIAGLKALNYELMTYLNDHKYYPTSLADFENNGMKQDFSKTGYIYAYYPKVNPIHYHLGMKIDKALDCNTVVSSNFKNKANFNSKALGYIGGFDGTDMNILDFHDSNNGQ